MIAWLAILLIIISFIIFFLLKQNVIEVLSNTFSNTSIAANNEFIVTEGLLESVLTITGTIEPDELINFSAPFDGVITEKHFDFGNLINKDQVLLVLDTKDLQIRIKESQVSKLKAEQAKNDLQNWEHGPEVARASRSLLSAKLLLADTKRKAAESEALLKRGIVPRSEYDSYLEQIRGLELQVETADDDLKGTIQKSSLANQKIAILESNNASEKYDQLLRDYQNSTIKSSISGIISMPLTSNNGQSPSAIEIGNRVSKGQSLFTILPVNKFKVAAKVDEADVTQISPNGPASIHLESQGIPPILGKISRIALQATLNVGGPRAALFEIDVKMPTLTQQQLQAMRIGMTCTLSIVKYRNPHAIVIPFSFIEREQGNFYTWVKTKDTPLQKQPIVLGRTTESGIEILKGLSAGDRIVSSHQSDM